MLKIDAALLPMTPLHRPGKHEGSAGMVPDSSCSRSLEWGGEARFR